MVREQNDPAPEKWPEGVPDPVRLTIANVGAKDGNHPLRWRHGDTENDHGERQRRLRTADQKKFHVLLCASPCLRVSVVKSLSSLLERFPRPSGEPAFDPAVIEGNVERLATVPEVDTGHPFLDRAVRTGLAHVDATFQGDHPKYGVKAYGANRHDAFPPTIIAAVDALSAWGLNGRAAELFRYWLTHFVRDDGSIDYYGPSISEYGQLLHTSALLAERTGGEAGDPGGWWEDGAEPLSRLAGFLLGLREAALRRAQDGLVVSSSNGEAAAKDDGLIVGVPEADTRDAVARYFHNNAWAARGLARWADLCERLSWAPSRPVEEFRAAAEGLAADTLSAIERTWPDDPGDWWLPPQAEPVVMSKHRPRHLTDTELASYTNYRYWPELLSSGLLPRPLANRLVDARISAGGQFCGVTRFRDHLDDWPLADYLYGLWSIGRRDDFLLSLYGHVAYHQAEGHLTAYEQISLPPGEEIAPYCLPCQLVAARAARLLVR